LGVAVVRGGVIGLFCAYELNKRELDVIGLDAGEMGSVASCSCGNAGRRSLERKIAVGSG
jgi:glycine/D-amino acid oxidase-like deaminating enzyme